MESQWYVVHTLTGQEEKVRKALQHAIETNESEGTIHQVLVPMEKVSEVKAGKKKISERRVFPGYVLVQMAMTDETWYFIKNTPGVSGFVGSGRRPVALKEEEVTQILQSAQESAFELFSKIKRRRFRNSDPAAGKPAPWPRRRVSTHRSRRPKHRIRGLLTRFRQARQISCPA